jgi:hypothetical protein
MYKLRHLIELTPKEVIKKSKSVSVNIVRSIQDLDREGRVMRKIQMKARDPKGSGKFHTITMKAYGGNKNILDDEVWVHCNCEYFCFHLEVALHAENSSSVINSNGNMPIVTNQGMVGHLCKHLMASIKQVRAVKFTDNKKNYKTSPVPTEEELLEELLKYKR